MGAEYSRKRAFEGPDASQFYKPSMTGNEMRIVAGTSSDYPKVVFYIRISGSFD